MILIIVIATATIKQMLSIIISNTNAKCGNHQIDEISEDLKLSDKSI